MTAPTLAPRSLGKKLALRTYRAIFRMLEFIGVHVTPVHYTQPIPDTRKLPESLWTTPSTVPGVDLNQAGQLALLAGLREYQAEYERLAEPGVVPAPYRYDNDFFGPVDAEVFYAMVRYIKPQRLIEIGSGSSTLIALAALERNANPTPIVCYEPFPNPELATNPRVQVLRTGIQQAPVTDFECLGPNDILFIDSTHIAQTGSDVVYEFLEILPRLRSGVIVHVHDIFIPYEYPRKWLKRDLTFYNEQYVLQAFLAHNEDWEVMFGNAYMAGLHPDLVAQAFSRFTPTVQPGSFWMRRR